MILVDTTVWVDFFAGRPLPHVDRLGKLIESESDLCICGLVLTEVLQGIRSDGDYLRTREYLGDLLYLPMREQTYIVAAELYRDLRRQGITIRKPVDCMIASVALQYDAELLHNDRDFDPIAEHRGLRIASSLG